jgi:hypothetical protein
MGKNEFSNKNILTIFYKKNNNINLENSKILPNL